MWKNVVGGFLLGSGLGNLFLERHVRFGVAEIVVALVIIGIRAREMYLEYKSL